MYRFFILVQQECMHMSLCKYMIIYIDFVHLRKLMSYHSTSDFEFELQVDIRKVTVIHTFYLKLLQVQSPSFHFFITF